ncbi:MAG: FAD-dependent oxidoreductase [Acidobacteria bacterium]|nr:FAD-dependent oxidoreductase [Acidobacteriota bacterium]
MRSRREFLLASSLSVLHARELKADVAVIGGGTGGFAAAVAALRNGMRVVMTEETQWIGGQLTSQMVPPDEHPWIEQFGGTRLYRNYRDRIRAYYRDHYPLTPEARARWNLNPGDGNVSRITHEPHVSVAVLEAMLAPYISAGQLILLREFAPSKVDIANDRIRGVTVRSVRDAREKTITAPYFIDATEQGDLLEIGKIEHVTGFESQNETNEPHAPAKAQPANIQSFTVCFAVDYVAGEDHTIEKPREYAFWRDYVPAMKPAWPGKLLSWSMSDPISLKPRNVIFDPSVDNKPGGPLNLFIYRRIANKRNFAEGAYPGDISLINWPQNDYWLGNIHGGTPSEAGKHLERGKQLSLSLLYWMQTESPRPDGGAGWKGLRLRGDLAGTEDGLAMYPYIRESRRIQAEFTVLEQHVGTDARMQLTGKPRDEVTAEAFKDSVGVGSYRIDLHPSSGGDNYIDVSSLPFQIPLGALLPRRIENLLAGSKNLGVTHITNGCYRLHPVEWNIGEAAGAVAAEAVKTGHPPRKLRNDPKLLAALQTKLTAQGFELAWPKVTPR